MKSDQMRMKTGYMKTLRLQAMLTQDELAEKAGLAVSSVSRLETGLASPRISSVRKLAAALGVEFLDLVDIEELNSGA